MTLRSPQSNSDRRFPGGPRAARPEPRAAAPVMRELPAASTEATEATDPRTPRAEAVSRFLTEQRLAADVRSLLGQLDPNRAEAWRRWREHRTRTAELSVTVSWADSFAEGDDGHFVVPHLAAVLESLLIGAATVQDDLTVEEEAGLYRSVVEELGRRIDAMAAAYD